MKQFTDRNDCALRSRFHHYASLRRASRLVLEQPFHRFRSRMAALCRSPAHSSARRSVPTSRANSRTCCCSRWRAILGDAHLSQQCPVDWPSLGGGPPQRSWSQRESRARAHGALLPSASMAATRRTMSSRSPGFSPAVGVDPQNRTGFTFFPIAMSRVASPCAVGPMTRVFQVASRRFAILRARRRPHTISQRNSRPISSPTRRPPRRSGASNRPSSAPVAICRRSPRRRSPIRRHGHLRRARCARPSNTSPPPTVCSACPKSADADKQTRAAMAVTRMMGEFPHSALLAQGLADHVGRVVGRRRGAVAHRMGQAARRPHAGGLPRRQAA